MTHSSSNCYREACPESSSAVGKMLKKFQHDKETVRLAAFVTDNGHGEKDVVMEEDL